MKDETVKELREQAKARGIKGYSKLTKDQLVELLSAPASAPKAPTPRTRETERRARTRPKPGLKETKPTETVARPAKAAKPAAAATVTASATAHTPPHQPAPASAGNGTDELLVEDAKYALRPYGEPAPPPPADLGEDIERLPALTEPMVCLLAQKPGVLYAYWLLPPGEAAQHESYRLRLCRAVTDGLEVYDEIEVRQDRGSWYFHVPAPAAGHDVLVQLGYYREGQFVSAQGQSMARLPSLYASSRTDHRWWISEDDFARMYQRAGGIVTGAHRYSWDASSSSLAGAPGAPAERMVWPGGVSSPSK